LRRALTSAGQYELRDGRDGPPWGSPIVGNTIRLMAAKCSTCIFRPGAHQKAIVRGSVTEAAAVIRERDTYVNCHQTLGAPGQPGAICRGSNDAHEGLMMRLAKAEGYVVREMTEAEVLAEGAAS
jgi:hypothetical protein